MSKLVFVTALHVATNQPSRIHTSSLVIEYEKPIANFEDIQAITERLKSSLKEKDPENDFYIAILNWRRFEES